ncbi:MAG: aspartate aminotransferase family protein [Opitutales bacterium]
MNTLDAYPQYLLSTYRNPPPVVLVRGQGATVWDQQGKAYLDCVCGIAVNALGHGHPRWVEAVRRQTGELVSVSNLYGTRQQPELARRLVEKAGPGKVYFCNSGAEANEALIKLSRLYGRRKAGGEEGRIHQVVVAENAFHGRTFGGMSATPQAKIRKGFGPLVPGFVTARLNDIASFEKAIDDKTSAVFVESIQGEGGLHPADPTFLRDLRALCDERSVLLMIDEVQCGIGRTGRFFAYEESGIEPDAIGMAKGLGGGFPIGAIWVNERHAGLFEPGSHGSTFGGSPLACAAALATLDILEEETVIEQVRERSVAFHQALAALADRHPAWLSGWRGRGYMIGLVLNGDWAPVLQGLALEAGLLVPPAGPRVLRLLPPLTVDPADLEKAISILDELLTRNTPPES